MPLRHVLKGINLGAKQTGKIAAGIQVFNTTRTTATAPVNRWVRIGNGDASHPLFTLTPIQPVSAPATNGINDYFSLTSSATLTQTQTQRLTYLGKRASLYCSYAVTISTIPAEPPAVPVEFGARISIETTEGLISTPVPQSIRTFRFVDQSDGANHTFPVVIPTGTSVYLEIARLTDVVDTDAVIVLEAYVFLYE